jgi:hypothetical protein
VASSSHLSRSGLLRCIISSLCSPYKCFVKQQSLFVAQDVQDVSRISLSDGKVSFSVLWKAGKEVDFFGEASFSERLSEK